MKKCMFCGAENPDDVSICKECGVSFEYYDQDHPVNPEELEVLESNEKEWEQAEKRPDRTACEKTHPAIRKKPGALAACALFAILLCHLGGMRVLKEYLLLHLACLIPGLIAFMNAINLNFLDTNERQEQKENAAIVLCAVGTILGIVLLLIKTH